MAGPGLERFEHNWPGYKRVMRSDGVVAHLQGLADDIALTAEAELFDDGDVFVIADTQVGKTRAGATVIGVPMRLEVEERILGRAVRSAGR